MLNFRSFRKSNLIYFLRNPLLFCRPSLLPVIMIISLTVLHFRFLMSNAINYLGDTSLLVSHVQSIKFGNGWANQYLASNIQALQNSTQSASSWCENIIGSPLLEINGGLSEHAYLYLPFLSLVSKVLNISAVQVYMGAMALAHLAPLIYIFLLARNKQKKNVFILLLAIYTNIITLNLLSAQPHIEQLTYLFVPPFLFFLFTRFMLGNVTTSNFCLLVMSGVLTIGISERVSLISGLFSLSTCIFLIIRKNFVKQDMCISLLALIQISWFVIWNNFFSASFYYDQISVSNLFQNLFNIFIGDMLQHTLIFFLVNLATLFLILQRKIYSVWALLAFLPNLLVTVGGAEKDAFAISQYHAFYFSVSTTLFVLLSFYYSEASSNLVRNFAFLLLPKFFLINSILLMTIVPQLSNSYESYSIAKFPSRLVYPFIANSGSDVSTYAGLNRSIENLDKGAIISVPEEIAMLFVKNGFYNLRYYPTGLADAKIVIAPEVVSGQKSYSIGGLPAWFQNENESIKLGSCVSRLLDQNNFMALERIIHKSKTYIVYIRS
jgi:hypothetical protein